MRIHFDHRTTGIFRKQLEVVVSVHFDDAELAIINKYGYAKKLAMHRPPTVYLDHKGNQRQIDNNIYLSKLLKYAHVEPVPTHAHGQAFEAEFMEWAEAMKNGLAVSHNPPKSKVYEL